MRKSWHETAWDDYVAARVVEWRAEGEEGHV